MRLPTSRYSTRGAAPATFFLSRTQPARALSQPVRPQRKTMLNSVRVRLTFWHAGAVACVLLILASGTYLLLRQNSIRRVDSSLVDVANGFLATVQAELRDAHESETFRHCVGAAIQEHSFRETAFSVFSAQGKLILASPMSPLLLESEAQRYDDLRRQAISEDATRRPFRTLKASGHLYRGYSRLFTADGATYVLVTLQSLRGEKEFLAALEQTYALVIPLAVLLAGVGGYFLARRSLSPVVSMSNQAERISAKNMQDRLAVRNTKDELGQLAVSFNRLLDCLDELVADCARNFRAIALAKRITLTCTPSPELLVSADEALLRRMFLNLLDNAIKYTPVGGGVTVSCNRVNAAYAVTFSDNGPGVPLDLQPRIFERLFRADDSRGRQDSSSGGAGLGLAICRWIAGAHHGTLELTKSDAAGSTFTFSMPVPDDATNSSAD